MTQLLKEAFQKAGALPPADQDRLARRWLKDVEALPPAEASGDEPDDKPFVSAFDLVKHLAGSLDGPGDLSTNPAYLDDLGESSMR